MTRSTVVFWSTAAALAIGLGVLVAKRAPALPSPSSASASASAQPEADSSNQQQHYTLRFVKNPEPVPQFSVTSFSGKMLEPSEWRGKVVILNFWATWCGPCRFEIPELMRLQKKFPNSLQVVGLSVDQKATPAEVKQFAQRMGITYPVGMASEQLQNKFGGILALPTSFILNRQGKVVTKHVGLVPEGYYETEIAYLAGRQVNANVKSFVDEGQVFPSNVKNAKKIPGVDMSMLTPAQRKLALKRMNTERCTCGCDYTVAQCRVLDSSCPVSLKEAKWIVAEIRRAGPVKTSTPAKTKTPASSSTAAGSGGKATVASATRSR